MRSRKPFLFIDCEIIINTFQCFDIHSRQDLKKSQFCFNPISVTLFLYRCNELRSIYKLRKTILMRRILHREYHWTLRDLSVDNSSTAKNVKHFLIIKILSTALQIWFKFMEAMVIKLQVYHLNQYIWFLLSFFLFSEHDN